MLSVAFSLIAVRIPFLETVEEWLIDFRIATLSVAAPQRSDMAILVIDERTLAAFPYRSPVDRAFLAHILDVLDAHGTRAVFLDFLFDQPTEPAKDERLKTRLRTFARPLVVSYTSGDLATADQRAYMDDFVPRNLRGVANLVAGIDGGVVRWIHSGREAADGGLIPSVPYAMARKLGHDVESREQRIDWSFGPDSQSPPFPILPALGIDSYPASWFADKVVLVGVDLAIEDRHLTSLSMFEQGAAARMSGVVVQAHAVAQLLDGRRAPEIRTAAAIAFPALAALAGAFVVAMGIPLVLRYGLALACLAALWVGGFAAYRLFDGLVIPLIAPSLALALSLTLAEGYLGRTERHQREFIKRAFSHYVSPKLVDRLVLHPEEMNLSGERREMSYIFTDIAGFTSTAENSDPKALAALLNDYFDGICRVIFDHDGSVDDFIGDAVFAVFGAPVVQSDHAKRAVQCARAIDRFASAFRKSEAALAFGLGDTRIGVHTGPAVIGNLGARDRFKYTPIGDAVNTASRVEGLNKYFGTRVCASEDIVNASGDIFARPLGRFILVGRSVPLQLYELLEEDDWRSDYIARYVEAYRLLDCGDPAAKGAFDALRQDRPDDSCVSAHCQRLEDGAMDTIVRMASK